MLPVPDSFLVSQLSVFSLVIHPSRLPSVSCVSTRTLSTWTSCPNADAAVLSCSSCSAEDLQVQHQGVAFTCGSTACSFVCSSCQVITLPTGTINSGNPHICNRNPITQPHRKSDTCLCKQAELLSFYHHYLVQIDLFNASSCVFWLTSFGLGCWMLFIVNKKHFDYKEKQSI